MSGSALLTQLPRLSRYDIANLPEGGLDPLGLAAVADRIADQLVPGVRARMSQPRFVTLSAVAALACEPLADLVAADGSTKFDVAFEWLVVEALIRHGTPGQIVGLPGAQKARRARTAGDRLSASSYLSGPRVFGFTGVYRPFSVATGVLNPDGIPGASAENLVRAWEQGQRVGGFVEGTPRSSGQDLRAEILKSVRDSLTQARCAAPANGWLLRTLARVATPGGAGKRERRVMRSLVVGESGEIRATMVSLLLRLPTDVGAEHDMADGMLALASGPARDRLRAAIDYERCATVADNAFRRLLRHGGAQSSGLVKPDDAAGLEFLRSAASRLPDLTRRAIDSAGEVDETIAHLVAESVCMYEGVSSADDLFATLLARHSAVQAGKGKREWLDDMTGGWCVRPQYRDQPVSDNDDQWAHPMRLQTLARFVRETAT